MKNLKESGTVGGYVFTLRVLGEFLIKHGMLTTNWANGIKPPRGMKKLPEILSIEEIELLLRTHPHRQDKDPDTVNFLWDTLFLFLATTGARISEVLNAQLKDLDLVKGSWHITDSKTRKQRYVPLSEPLIKKLQRLTTNRASEEYLFTAPQFKNKNGKPMSSQLVRYELKLRKILAGITKLATIHTFRHSFITELLRQDISILKVAQIAGHENVVTTQNYAKLLFEDLTNAINRHPIISKTRNPYEIMEHIKQTIKSFRLSEDKRFFFELSEGNEGLRLNLFVR